MEWQQTFCGQAAFLLKTDDDTVVHIPRLLHHIQNRFRLAMNGTKSLFGYILTSSPVLHSGRWAVTEDAYTPDYYPPYCHGANYLLSNDAVAAILAGAANVKSFQIEDALYTGVIASNVGIQKVSDEDVFFRGGQVTNVTKCDEHGVPLASTFYFAGDAARRQAGTFALMKNQTCA